MQATTIYSNEETNELVLSVPLTEETRKCMSYLNNLRKQIVFENDKELLFKATLADGWEENTEKYPMRDVKFTFNSLDHLSNCIRVEYC